MNETEPYNSVAVILSIYLDIGWLIFFSYNARMGFACVGIIITIGLTLALIGVAMYVAVMGPRSEYDSVNNYTK